MADRSRMNREVHVRICGGLEVKFLRSTRLWNFKMMILLLRNSSSRHNYRLVICVVEFCNTPLATQATIKATSKAFMIVLIDFLHISNIWLHSLPVDSGAPSRMPYIDQPVSNTVP